MHYKKGKEKLEVTLPGDFNLNAVRHISELLDDRNELHIDLKNSRFVNSKAIIFLNNLLGEERSVTVRLRNPPNLFFKLLQILGLHKAWNLDEIVEP